MRKLILFLCFLIFSPIVLAQDAISICGQINELNNHILEGNISKMAAKTQFKNLFIALKSAMPKTTSDQSWQFPLQGYQSNAIGGVHGNGYSDKGYNYFDGNKHLAHPAHDIFIDDRNQDLLDDRTHQSVNVLAIADGVVLACRNEWDNASALRGGRYIWIYHPQLNTITYYAHNKEIFVSPGDEIRQGQKIAEVGRTGFNAFKKRAPTHLHFSAYAIKDNLPIPFNCYNELIKAKIKWN